MALSWDTQRAFPYLPTYAAAASHEANIKPVRGDKDRLKPLGRRDQKHHAIWRMPNGDIYATRGYLNPTNVDPNTMRWGNVMAIWRPNGDILLGAPAFGQKAAECEILEALFHVATTSRHNALWVDTRNKGAIQLHALIEDNIFRHNINGGLDGVSVRPQTTHAINRRGMREVRARYEGFRRYCHAMSKLRAGNPISIEERKRVIGMTEHGGFRYVRIPGSWGWRRDEDFASLAAHMQSDEPEDQYYAWMVFECGGGGSTDEKLDNTLMAMHPDECLITKEHTDGKIRKDAYRWVFT